MTYIVDGSKPIEDGDLNEDQESVVTPVEPIAEVAEEKPAAEKTPVKELDEKASVEEDVKSEEKPKDDRVHLSLNVPAGTLKELGDLADRYEKEIERLVKEPTSNEGADSPEVEKVKNLLVRMVSTDRGPMGSAHADFGTEMFDRPDAEYQQAKILTSSGSRFGQNLRGEAAKLAFTAKLRGLRKVMLYNSGFHVVIRPWSIAELSMFFQSVDLDDEELGRMLGYYRFTLHDVFVKSSFMDIFPSCVVSSNLRNWQSGHTLVNNISFNDYDTLLWAVMTNLVDEPLELEAICTKCENQFSGTYDIKKMCLIDSNIIPEKAIEFLFGQSEVIPSELKKYRNELLPNTNHTIKYGSLECDMNVPTIGEWLLIAKKSLAKVVAAANGSNSYSNRLVRNQTIIEFNRNYIPWIKEIRLLEDGEIVTSTQDNEVFSDIIGGFSTDDKDEVFYDEILNYIKRTYGTNIGFTPITCPSCGHKASTQSDLVSWDAEKAFFALTYQTLAVRGLYVS